MKKTFILHVDSLSILNEMTNEQKGILFDAIYKYQLGETIELDFAMKMAFAPFKNQFIRDEQSYNNVVERNRANGKNGGRPKKNNQKNPVGYLETQKTEVNPKNLDSDNDSDNDSVNDNDSKEKKNIYQDLLEFLNAETNKNYRIIPDKAKKQINARLKDGYTLDDIKNAITNCSKDKYHIENPQYLTLEFITRSDKLEKYVNMLAPAKVVSLKPTRDEIKARNWEYVVG